MAAALAWVFSGPAAGAEPRKLVVVVYPNESDGAPGVLLVDRALRATLAGQVEVRNEYVDTTRLRDTSFRTAQMTFLREKYAGRKVDLVVAGLSSGLDFVLAHRDELFPGVPVVYTAVEHREVIARKLPPDVIGVPVQMDLAGTLDLALTLHPKTRQVFVVAGRSPFDSFWEAEARRVFRPYESRVEFVYLTGLPMTNLLGRVADLPAQSLVYYLHVFQDGDGKPVIPAEALDRLAAVANAPIYGHVDTYVGRGVVGGRVFSFEAEGRNAAHLALRLLAGEMPGAIHVPTANEPAALFDGRQLRRWGVDERAIPPGSIVRHRELTTWDRYRWLILGGVTLCAVEAFLIAGLVVQLVKRWRADERLRVSRAELQRLTGKLLEAQESERRRIARELHDDINQTLALLAVEMDLLDRDHVGSDARVAGRMRDLSARVKQLSSAVHDLSHRLHPSKLEHLGLVAAVRGLCHELTRHHGLEVAFTHADVPDSLPEAAALCLYRIVQESLRNVVKHSGVGRAVVELSGTAGGVRLRVGDDGAGFDPTADHNGGLGLISMRERLLLVGGTIAIDSRPGAGTRIDVRVPTPDRPEDAR